MSRWDRQLSFRGWKWVASALGAASLAWVVLLGTRAREEPVRCGSLFESKEARCCAPGQGVSAGQCVGMPEKCPAPFLLVRQPTPGCVFPDSRVFIEGGSVTIGPTDWDSVEIVEKHTLAVRPYFIDQTEVTVHRYSACVADGLCEPLKQDAEPGRPVTGLSIEAATRFCTYSAGRLPTPAEWMFAASGSEGRRFPWGSHGLVCRRATYGLASGPCADGGAFPDLAGLHPEGATPEGIQDLAGNAAEWTLSEEGTPSVRGGSYRSKTAGDLKVWSTQAAQARDDVGFRCVYPVK